MPNSCLDFAGRSRLGSELLLRGLTSIVSRMDASETS